jgi:hypothetical protein
MKSCPSNPGWLAGRHPGTGLAFLCLLLGLFFGGNVGTGAEPPALTEYQVKALFLQNFAKYVDWPAEAFARDDTPITIGVIGENKFGDALSHAVAGKSFNGRGVSIRKIESAEDWGKCHILFISASEQPHWAEILAKIKAKPVLTVGEGEQFVQRGGIISFIRKEDKVRLDIGLDAAREARLRISSKLLAVADQVHGEP